MPIKEICKLAGIEDLSRSYGRVRLGAILDPIEINNAGEVISFINSQIAGDMVRVSAEEYKSAMKLRPGSRLSVNLDGEVIITTPDGLTIESSTETTYLSNTGKIMHH